MVAGAAITVPKKSLSTWTALQRQKRLWHSYVHSSFESLFEAFSRNFKTTITAFGGGFYDGHPQNSGVTNLFLEVSWPSSSTKAQ